MKKIPRNVQSLLKASNQINNHCKAVEELVYNALDAAATSVAIRINIQENQLQLIDNGCGISSKDFKLLGHNYMSSKFNDIQTLQPEPNKYGFRGQALSSLVNISKTVKIVSRHESSDKTWLKLFEHGQEKQIEKCNSRPSKGTTVEVTGLLYNFNKRYKSRDILKILHNIKLFLEHISLVHCNISLSLRDDSKNEILFDIHKNRDIPKTLSKLYNIEQSSIQELQVEKNEYKVTAFIGNSENVVGKQLISLNGKLVAGNSTLHKTVNGLLARSFKHKAAKPRIKKKVMDDENKYIQKNLPDYFMFIKCPKIDYDFGILSKQTALEFKNWNQMHKLFDKVIKFYNGDLILQNINVAAENQTSKKSENKGTREQVRKIMEKVLGNDPRKSGTMNVHTIKLNIHNGVRGKNIKRKNLKSCKYTKTVKDIIKESNKNSNFNLTSSHQYVISSDLSYKNERQRKENKSSKLSYTSKRSTGKGKKYNQINKKLTLDKMRLSNDPEPVPSHDNNKDRVKNKYLNNKQDLKLKKLTRKYEQDPKINLEMLDHLHKMSLDELLTKDSMSYNATENNFDISMHKQMNDKVNEYHAVADDNTKLVPVLNKLVETNYDLLKPVLKSCKDNFDADPKLKVIEKSHAPRNSFKRMTVENNMMEMMTTYKSHNYSSHHTVHREYNDTYHSHMQIHHNKRNFITKRSIDNFGVPNEAPKRRNVKKMHRPGLPSKIHAHIKSLFKQTSKLFNLKKQIMGTTSELSYTIKFTESNKYDSNNKDDQMRNLFQNRKIEDIQSWSVKLNGLENEFMNTSSKFTNIANKGYTRNSTDCYWRFDNNDVDIKNNQIDNNEWQERKEHDNEYKHDTVQNDRNYIFITKSQANEPTEPITDPVYVCETIFNSEKATDSECVKLVDPMEVSCFTNIEINKEKSKLVNDKEIIKGTEEHNVIQDRFDSIEIVKVSHHFDLPSNKNPVTISLKNIQDKVNDDHNNTNTKKTGDNINPTENDDFNFINRLCFVPKGLSPIFQNCQTKTACEFIASGDYYEKKMYTEFVENVKNNADVYEPNIQDLRGINTKAIDKVSVKLAKDDSALKFDGKCIADAKVLGQIDDKFIAAIMKESSNTERTLEYLVLFDQHAVHERIRLENNLRDYILGNQWKPLSIDEFTLKLSKDDILYMHNFKEKFAQLGLNWRVVNTHLISINAIPEAIVGKNPRQVDKVIKAIRNLIAEEINAIKMQGGCTSLYPKSITDLVFSEACRYSIKFGDKLSKVECVELLKSLSECKTPFQCAHGRPVMAVLIETQPTTAEYKISLMDIIKWQRMRNEMATRNK